MWAADIEFRACLRVKAALNGSSLRSRQHTENLEHAWEVLLPDVAWSRQHKAIQLLGQGNTSYARAYLRSHFLVKAIYGGPKQHTEM